MTTKYSKRPAPRKRPWICKRSPPCLIAPPIPPDLVATFALQKTHPPPQGPYRTGSLLLKYRPFFGLYDGAWAQGSDGFALVFNYTVGNPIAVATASWDLDTLLDWGAYQHYELIQHPKLLYTSRIVDATNFRWRAILDITG